MILVVDHYDSFTYNLVQLVESLGHATEVVKSDAEPAEELVARGPEAVDPLPRARATPGRRLLPRAARAPAADDAGAGRLSRASGDRHRERRHRGSHRAGAREGLARLPRGQGHPRRACPIPFEAGRYHSLVVVRDDLPAELELTAWTEDGLVMATQHRELPRYGVQFHPESILTPEGPRIVENFLALARAIATGPGNPGP